MDLCIVCPEIVNISVYNKSILESRSDSIFNMDYLSDQLRSIGMINITSIKKARVPICTFKDPEYGITCDINVGNILGIENTNLILQYMKIDSRVKPFLFALKLFVKSKEIQNSKFFFLYIDVINQLLIISFYKVKKDFSVHMLI